jgi:DNA polymerase V
MDHPAGHDTEAERPGVGVVNPPRHPDIATGTYTGAETTGFASPAGDHVEGPIDLSDVLDLGAPNRYPVRVAGAAMEWRGIVAGDVLIVDASAEPQSGSVVIIMMGSQVLLAQVVQRRGHWWIRSGKPDQPPVLLAEDAEVWGVVRSLVRVRI